MSLITLDNDFFQRDSLTVALELLGCIVVSKKSGGVVKVRIVETEAYPATDPASHAYLNKVTPRNKMQYEAGGLLYLYLIMGLHIMTSIVTNTDGVADVVFLRAAEPVEGLPLMIKRRGLRSGEESGLTNGPGKLTQALGLSLADNGKSVCDHASKITILKDTDFKLKVSTAPRINLGLSGFSPKLAKQSREMPWRFFVNGNAWVSG